jgi:hypothetical protein
MLARMDTTDVPAVAAEQLAMAMRFMLDSDKGLVLLRGATDQDLRALEDAIWDRLDGDLAHRRAVLLRFQHLISVFSARRLRALMLRRGYNLIAPALLVAASMRLNTKWGFSPHKFFLAINELPSVREVRPSTPVEEVQMLQAA